MFATQMNGILAIWLVLACTVAGCATTSDAKLRDRLVGSWLHDVNLMGQHTRAVLTLFSDGTFVEERDTQNAVVRVRQQLQGTWQASDRRIDFAYPKGFTGEGGLETDSRVITLLTDSDFVSEDTKFRIGVARKRLVTK